MSNNIEILINCNDLKSIYESENNYLNFIYFKLKILENREFAHKAAGKFSINIGSPKLYDLIIMNECSDDNLLLSASSMQQLINGGYLYIIQLPTEVSRSPIELIPLLNGSKTNGNDFLRLTQEYKYHNIDMHEYKDIHHYSNLERSLNEFCDNFEINKPFNEGLRQRILKVIMSRYSLTFDLFFPNINEKTVKLLIRNEKWLVLQTYIYGIIMDGSYGGIIEQYNDINKGDHIDYLIGTINTIPARDLAILDEAFRKKLRSSITQIIENLKEINGKIKDFSRQFSAVAVIKGRE